MAAQIPTADDVRAPKKRRGWRQGEVYRDGAGWAIRWREDGHRRFKGGLPSRQVAEAALASIRGRLVDERVRGVLNGTALIPRHAGELLAWATERWATMNPRERQAVAFVLGTGRCGYCGRDVTIPVARERSRPDRAVMDHVIPVSGGGSDALPNITLACHACNMKKFDAAR